MSPRSDVRLTEELERLKLLLGMSMDLVGFLTLEALYQARTMLRKWYHYVIRWRSSLPEYVGNVYPHIFLIF
jgi:hypothetical protein